MKALILITSMILTACGTVIPEEKGSLKLTDETPNFVAKERTPIAPSTTGTVTPESESDNSVEATETEGESGTVSIMTQSSEPRTPEQQRLDQMGVDYFIDGQTVYVRERDWELAQAAIADFSSPLAWNLALRPDSEILTSRGFVTPPPSVETILANRGIADYEIDGLDIYLKQDYMGDASLLLNILAVFYPDTAWNIIAIPSAPIEQEFPNPDPIPGNP